MRDTEFVFLFTGGCLLTFLKVRVVDGYFSKVVQSRKVKKE